MWICLKEVARRSFKKLARTVSLRTVIAVRHRPLTGGLLKQNGIRMIRNYFGDLRLFAGGLQADCKLKILSENFQLLIVAAKIEKFEKLKQSNVSLSTRVRYEQKRCKPWNEPLSGSTI